MTSRSVTKWLVHLADPLGPKTPRPSRPLTPAQLTTLFTQAELHGVLAFVLRNIECPSDNSPFGEALAEAVRRHRDARGFCLMLQFHGEAVMRAVMAAGLPAIIVKGPVFARWLYPERALRRYTDIDLLVAPEAVAEIGRLLAEQGFKPEDMPKGPDAREWKWVYQDNCNVMIEVQSDLVHSDALRATMSLTYRDLTSDGRADQAERPAALLVVAAVHGAGHQYERLLHVVDICQAARCLETPDDERQLDALIDQTGSRLAVVTGLNLAGSFFSDQRCLDLAKALGPVRYARAGGILISRSVATSTMSEARWVYSWRRAAYRELLKRRKSRQGRSALA